MVTSTQNIVTPLKVAGCIVETTRCGVYFQHLSRSKDNGEEGRELY
jgi:hypothetical protein